MLPRPTILIGALAAATLVTGCGTFDDDVVASVNGAELTSAELTERYEARRASLDLQTEALLFGALPEGRLQGDLARSVVDDFIRTELLREVGVIDLYDAGPDESGVVCLELALAADLVAAEATVAALDDGEDWATVWNGATDRSNGCAPLSDLGPIAEQFAGIGFDDPYRALQFETGAAVVSRLVRGDEAPPVQLYGIVSLVDDSFLEPLVDAQTDADVHVDPQFGVYVPDVPWFLGDAQPSVVPLG